MIELNIQKTLSDGSSEFKLRLSLEIISGAFIAIYGPSGAGKTTFLRLLAGLEQPDSGTIIVDDEEWVSSERSLPVQERSIGFVFQDYALFPNMTVRENLQFAGKKSSEAIINELLDMMNIEDLSQRMPATLSGGQKQRVALARALVRQPKLLLLDEPLSALDRDMRRRLQDDILKLHKRFKTTAVLVSHDLSEIFRLADQVVILQDGQVQRSGSVSDVFIGKEFSGKFRFQGEVLHIEQADAIFIVTLSIGNQLAKVVATPEEITNINIGDHVLVSSKAFNPLIIPLKSQI
ncbi:MAG: ABC transporter ATP-binding protein [Calditrichia bacterium]